MSTTTVEVPLSDQTRERLKEVAARNRQSEAEVAATFIEGALAADDLEIEIIRQRLAQADSGGPFARHEDVLAWLKALSEGQYTCSPDWFVRMTRPGIDLDSAIDENRTPHESWQRHS